MQNYDLLMLGVLVGATIFGFWKGMAWQIASLAALVVSYYASLSLSDQLAPVFGQQAPLNKYIAMLAIYVGASFVVWMLFRLVSGFIDKIRLESFDKQLGGTLGLAEGVCLCVVITLFVLMLWPAQRDAIASSRSGHYIVVLLDKANPIFPPEVHQVVDPYLNKLQEQLNPSFQPRGQDGQASWPTQPASGWSQTASPQPAAPQPGPPQAQQPPAQFGWPTGSQQQPAPPSNPYGVPREPNPFPGSYSAQVPGGRDY
jgi:membrane protein required for colicin V production